MLINTLELLLRGDKMTSEQFKEMLRYVKTNKRKAAEDMLASYAEGALNNHDHYTMGTQRNHRPPPHAPVYSFAAIRWRCF